MWVGRFLLSHPPGGNFGVAIGAVLNQYSHSSVLASNLPSQWERVSSDGKRSGFIKCLTPTETSGNQRL